MIHLTLFLSALTAWINKYRRFFLSLSFFLLFVFSSIRYNYGNDYDSYYTWYRWIHIGGASPYKSQVGFTWLNMIMPNFFVMVIVISFLFLWSVYLLIRDNVEEQCYGLAVMIFVINPYLFLINLSAMRQSIAIALFIVAVYFAGKRKIIPYVLIILLAGIFHTSALVLLPFYLIINDKKINVFFGVIVFVVLLVFFIDTNLFNNSISLILSAFDEKEYNNLYADSTGNSLRATILSLVSLLYVVINLHKLSRKNLMYSKLYLVSMILAVFEFRLSMLTRIQMYFDIFSVVALPAIFYTNLKTYYGKWDRIFNVYLFPAAILIIYLARYYSFFTNPLWKDFWQYNTLLSLI